MLAPCMYEAFHILRLDVASHQGQVLASYRNLAKDALAYGADWCRASPHHIATCSFYDHKLCIWQPKSKEELTEGAE